MLGVIFDLFHSYQQRGWAGPGQPRAAVFAVPMLLITHTVLTGQLFPFQAEPYRWLWFSLSGIVGLVIGDTLLFTCYSLIGNRLGTLIMSCVPVISSPGCLPFPGRNVGSAQYYRNCYLRIWHRPGSNGTQSWKWKWQQA